jgi:hypothetical protein
MQEKILTEAFPERPELKFKNICNTNYRSGLFRFVRGINRPWPWRVRLQARPQHRFSAWL